jgi:hypothetical protein
MEPEKTPVVRISYTITRSYEVEVYAKDYEEAKRKFHASKNTQGKLIENGEPEIYDMEIL